MVMQRLALVSAGLVSLWFVYLLTISDAAWLHPEALASSVYVWAQGGGESFAGMLRKALDWKAFDPNVNRVRPLNDAVEVVDAIARPYIAVLFGAQPSLNVSTVATALLAPGFFFAWCRRVLGAWAPALMIALVFVSTVGFLSLTIAYIHPAKRINLVLLCAALLFAQRAEEKPDLWDFGAMFACLLASFFSDELALANYVIVGMIYWRMIADRLERVVAFALMPFLFLAATKWVLPALYQSFSVHGAWDALADGKKFAVFGYLLSAEFHLAAARQLGRSILSTVGISTHTPASEMMVIAGLLAATAASAYQAGVRRVNEALADKAVLAAIALAATNWFATLLDWYPFPHEISYLGSFNYYYHSSVVVPVLAWAVFVLRSLFPYPTAVRDAAVTSGAAIVVVTNFAMFSAVNTLAQVIHYYPYPPQALFGAVAEISELPRGARANVTVHADTAGEEQRFEDGLRSVFGERWDRNGFYRTHKMLAPTPIMSDAHIGHLLKSYRPWVPATVTIVR